LHRSAYRHGAPFRDPASRTAPHHINSIRVHYRPRAVALLLSFVDAAPTREDTRQAAPGDQTRSAARESAASTIGPMATWRQRDKRALPSKRLRDSLGSRRR